MLLCLFVCFSWLACTVVIVVVYTLFFGNFGQTSETSLGKTGNSETSGENPP